MDFRSSKTNADCPSQVIQGQGGCFWLSSLRKYSGADTQICLLLRIELDDMPFSTDQIGISNIDVLDLGLRGILASNFETPQRKSSDLISHQGPRSSWRLLFFRFCESLIPLFPFAPKLECYLNRNKANNNPFKVNTVLLTHGLSEDAGDLLSIVHLLVQGLDPNTDVESPSNLVIVTFEAQLMSTIPEEIRQ